MSLMMHAVGGNGAPVVLIHGFGADRLGWIATSPALLENHSVWAAELPAHGAADPGPITPPDMARALIDHLPQTDEPIALVGHSLGGTVAAHIAALAKERIGKTVLIAPAGFGAGRPSVDFLTGLPKAKDEDEALALLRLLVVRQRLILPQMAQHVLKHLDKPGRRAALAEIADAALALDPPALPNGALVVWGEADTINPPDLVWLESLGDQALVLADTGHLPHVEAAAKVNRRIAEFLAS